MKLWPLVLFTLLPAPAVAHDTTGQYAQTTPQMREWFRSRQNKDGALCCDIGDGQDVLDTEWRRGTDGYQVFLDGQWFDVPEHSVVESENEWGPALVWLWRDDGGKVYIRCFLAGAGA